MNYLQYLENKYHFRNGIINSYLSVRKNRLFYKDIDLLSVVKKYKTPLEIIYPSMIDERVDTIIDFFNAALKKYQYKGSYTYAYASKTNYYEETISKILGKGCALETTSEYDARLALYLKKKGKIKKTQLIIFNGFKLQGYADIIKQIREKHENVIPVIENDKDIELLKDTRKKMKVGIRLKIDLASNKKKTFEQIYNRFGYYQNSLDSTATKISRIKNFDLKMLHVMVGSQIEDPKLFKLTLMQALKEYCKLKKKYPSLQYFNIGGGLPTQYNLEFHFDYKKFIFDLVKEFKKICTNSGIKEPDIVTEYGRYTVADYASNFFKIEYEKEIKGRQENWYIIDGSIMTMLPDAWALGQDFLLLPLNGYDRPIEKVWLAGITCDSDDVYHGSQNQKHIILPKISEELYVGFFGCGAYQANISGIGGVHHCMLPEPSELIIEKKKDKHSYHLVTRKQSFKRILKLLDYE